MNLEIETKEKISLYRIARCRDNQKYNGVLKECTVRYIGRKSLNENSEIYAMLKLDVVK